MYLIVGLGNPEKDYCNTRHNMGFDVINKLAEAYDIKVTKTKWKGLYGKGRIEGEQVILLKPQTYMNLSGESLIEFARFYQIPKENILVIYDDMDTETGKIRIRKKGSSGTHNGMKSVVGSLGTEEFLRIRVGIGMPEHKGNLISYVIGAIPEEDRILLDKGTTLAKEATVVLLTEGIDKAMNTYN